jgi:hypothetical protein
VVHALQPEEPLIFVAAVEVLRLSIYFRTMIRSPESECAQSALSAEPSSAADQGEGAGASPPLAVSRNSAARSGRRWTSPGIQWKATTASLAEILDELREERV